MNKKYIEINEQVRKELEEGMRAAIIRDCRKEMIEDIYKYEVQIQDIRFITYMSDNEIEESVRLAIELLEELKNINNNGIDRARLNEIEMSVKEKDELMQQLFVWNEIFSHRISEIIDEIDELRRVGGAYAMLISNPGLKSALYAVYDRIVDDFEDVQVYVQSAYFLLRAIMKMHSNEV